MSDKMRESLKAIGDGRHCPCMELGQVIPDSNREKIGKDPEKAKKRGQI